MGKHPQQFQRERHRAFWRVAVSLILIGFIFWVDLITTERYAFYVFYFPSLILLTWYGGSFMGFFAAIFCAGSWVVARLDAYHDYQGHVLAWNAVIRLITFWFVVAIAGRIKSTQRRLTRAKKEVERLLGLERKLMRLDPLTGVLNVRAFNEELTEEKERARRYEHSLSLLFLDLDHFKRINDQHGHLFGDEMLRKTVLVIKGVLRIVDKLGRMGGDEFAILLPETGQEGAEACAQRIQKQMQESFGPSLGVSIGVAIVSDLSLSNEEIIRIADKAMYSVKKKGRGGISSDSR